MWIVGLLTIALRAQQAGDQEPRPPTFRTGTNVVRVVQILPVSPSEADDKTQTTDYIYEPSKEALLSRLVPLYVQIQIYRAALESIAAFFGAQMMAMENATKNAGDMITRYTLQYNRARQASITKELAEIVGGAEALKG